MMDQAWFKGAGKALSSLICMALACACASFCFCIPPSDAGDTTTQIRSLEDQIAQLQKEKETLDNELASIKQSKSDAFAEKKAYESQINLLEKEIDSRDALIEQYIAHIDEAVAGIETKESEIDAKFDDFLTRLRLSYEDGFVGQLVLMLESGSFTEFLMNTERTADMLEYDRTLMQNMENEKNDLSGRKKELEEAKSTLETERENLAASKADLEQKRSQLNTYIDELQNDEEKKAQLRLAAIDADEELNKRLENLLASLNDGFKKYPVAGGSLIWPVDHQYWDISSGYGYREFRGRTEFHHGIDIPAPAGKNVYAAQSGTVVVAEFHYSYGNYVVINHGGGYSTLYAHHSALNVSVGQEVKQGDVIGFIGTTGTSTGNHVHFEIRKDGVSQHPLNYVTQPK